MREKFLATIAALLIRALGWTLRIRFEDETGSMSSQSDQRFIFAIWHNRLLITPILYERFYGRPTPAIVLTSASRDGTLLAEVVKRFGMGVIRGSSSRRGAIATREMAQCLEAGNDVAISPDGPRGPRYHLGPGIIFLAQRTGIPIVPIRVDYSRCVRLKSWDRFMIPLPFSRVTATFERWYQPAQTEGDAEFEAERARFEQLMQPDIE
jgi:lysophospholipid acyltransferase (LPLAT)-like uncharacterized protein